MPRRIITLVAIFFVVIAPTLPASSPRRDTAAFTQKLIGHWDGQGGCDGKLAINADGTYQLTEYGPGGSNSEGKWKIKWNSLPTLIFTCTKSDVAAEVGTSLKLTVLKLTDKNVKMGYPDPNGAPSGEYARAKK